MSTASTERVTLSDLVAGEVRSRLARRGTSLRAFAAELDVPEHWLVRRVAPGRSVALDLDDVALIAAGLDTTATELVSAAS